MKHMYKSKCYINIEIFKTEHFHKSYKNKPTDSVSIQVYTNIRQWYLFYRCMLKLCSSQNYELHIIKQYDEIS